jgi:DNA-binding winged helix-turn-helix (wHTH) protein/Flp pilus assembly protein TadD
MLSGGDAALEQGSCMLKIGEWLFDPATRRVLRGEVERKLSPKAAAVLMALAETPGQVWSRDALLERVWAGVFVGEEVLTHAIAELRRALGDDFRAPRFFETVHKSGYRLLQPALAFQMPTASAALTADFMLDADDEEAAYDLRWYGAYLKGCELFDRGGRENTRSAIATFSAVVDAEPTFGLAHAGAAKSLTFLATYYAPSAGDFETALEHCANAHRIASGAGSAQAYAAEGLIYAISGDFSRGMKRFRAALRLNAESGETHYFLGRACLAERQLELAATMLERAAMLRSDDYHSLMLAAKVRESTGEARLARAGYALALQRLEPRLAANPDDYRALCCKARCLWHLGRKDEAVALMEAIAAHPDPVNYHLACTFARAGQHGRALDVLEEVIALGWNHKAWLERDPDFDALRDSRRFKQIARSLPASSHQQL